MAAASAITREQRSILETTAIQSRPTTPPGARAWPSGKSKKGLHPLCAGPSITALPLVMKVLPFGPPGLIAEVLPTIISRAGHEVLEPSGGWARRRVARSLGDAHMHARA